MTALLAPAPRWVGPGYALLTAVLTLTGTWSLLRRPYLSWDATSSAFHEVLWFIGPIVAGGAALYCWAFHSRRQGLHVAYLRAGFPQVVRLTCGLVISAVSGLVAGMAPAVAYSWRSASWGALDPRDVAIALAGVMFFVCLGTCLGIVIAHWLSGIAAAIVAYLLASMPLSGSLRPVALLQPVQQWPATPQFHLSTATTFFTVNALVVGGLALAALTVTGIRPGVTVRRDAAVLLAAWSSIVIAAFVWRPDFYRPHLGVSLECSGVPEVCVHPAHSGSATEIREVVEAVRQVAPGAVAGRVVDSTSWTEDRRDGDLVVAVLFLSTDPRNLYQSTSEAVAADLTEHIFLHPCQRASEPAWADAHLIRSEVLRRSGYPELADRVSQEAAQARVISEMGDEDFRMLMQRHRDDLSACAGVS